MKSFSFVDPFDEQALHLFEDLLGVRCHCAQAGDSRYCPVHNGTALARALGDLELKSEAQVKEAIESAREKWNEQAGKEVEGMVNLLNEVIDATKVVDPDAKDEEPKDEKWWANWRERAENAVKEAQKA
ncbi:MAG: hypothetical protein WC969_15595 [Elusimicrobiota bacterium]